MLWKSAAGLNEEFLLAIFGFCSYLMIWWWYDEVLPGMQGSILLLVAITACKARWGTWIWGIVVTYHVGSSRSFGWHMLFSPADLVFHVLAWPHSSQEELITQVQTPRLMWKRSRGHPGFEWCLARSNLSKANKNKIMSQHLSLLPWKRKSYNPLVKSDPLAPLDSWVTLWWSVLHWLTSTTSFPACLQHANHVIKASQRWEGCARKGCRAQELL